jgi:hypothetical protein
LLEIATQDAAGASSPPAAALNREEVFVWLECGERSVLQKYFKQLLFQMIPRSLAAISSQRVTSLSADGQVAQLLARKAASMLAVTILRSRGRVKMRVMSGEAIHTVRFLFWAVDEDCHLCLRLPT